MGQNSAIEWTDATWNPLRGCTRVSEGCRNCYAERVAARFSGPGQPYEGLAAMTEHGPRWTGEIRLVHEHLEDPLRWREPRTIFVNSMSDLFHPDVPFEFVAAVFGIMVACPQHTFQVLTKRPERMAQWFSWLNNLAGTIHDGDAHVRVCVGAADHYIKREFHVDYPQWPLPNVWLGTSVESQETADKRIPYLLQVLAAVRFLSCEPLLGPVDLKAYGWLRGCDACCNGDRCPGPPECTRHHRPKCPVCKGTAKGWNVNWVIAGGESGPGARPMHPDWGRSLRDQCQAAQVPFFFKQWGEWVTEDQAAEDILLPGRSESPWAERDEDGEYTRGDQTVVYRVGKKAAGALLDGREWREMPVIAERGVTW